MLLRLEKKGWVQRLKRGHYALVDIASKSPKASVEDPFLVATDLFAPCYLGGWTAAEHWGLTEQIFNSILVYSSSYQRLSERTVGGIKFLVRRISKGHFFGTETEWSANHKIEFSDPHRTVIDILNRPEDGGGAIHVVEIFKSYLATPSANTDTLVSYAEKLNSGALFKRLGFLAEQLAPKNRKLISLCHKNITKGISRFDPTGPKKGPISTRWNLQLNLPMGDIQ
jgi:predicted transcriptional regulator of viral defense system